MKLNPKTRKRRLILLGSLAAAAVVATAVAVPIALLSGKSSSSSDTAEQLSAGEMELRAFMKNYPGTVQMLDGKYTIVTNAFKDRIDLPVGFTLPQLVTAIQAKAFEGAKLPKGMAISAKATDIDASAFANAVMDGDALWDKDAPVAGAKVDVVENSGAYRAFVKNYPGSLDKKAVAASAFSDRSDLPSDFALPYFVNKVGALSFARATLPAGFSLPASVADIGADAFKQTSLPLNFTIPAGIKTIDPAAFAEALIGDDYAWDRSAPVAGARIDLVENNDEYKAFVALYPGTLTKKKLNDRAFYKKENSASLPDNFKLPSFLTSIGEFAFYLQTLPKGFLLPSTVRSVGSRAFFGVSLPSGFTLPAALTDVGINNTDSFATAFFPQGFTLPGTVQRIYYAAFSYATMPIGFTIPASVVIYGNPVDPGALFLSPPPNAKWDNQQNKPIAGAALIEDTSSSSQ